MNKSEVVTKAKTITSALTQNEAEALYDYASLAPSGGIFVEIGSYLGCSSVVIGNVAEDNKIKFYMIDPFYETSIDMCKRNIKDRGVTNAIVLHKKSEDAVSDLKDQKINFLFIDGDHWYGGVKIDCEKYIPLVKKGGFILFHDYKSSWDGVKQAVDERDDLEHVALVDSLLVTKKI